MENPNEEGRSRRQTRSDERLDPKPKDPSTLDQKLMLAHYNYDNYKWACGVLGFEPLLKKAWEAYRRKHRDHPATNNGPSDIRRKSRCRPKTL